MIGTSVFGGAGILLLNSILARAAPQSVSSLLVLTFALQMVVPAVYHVVVTGGLTVAKGTGFALAVTAAILFLAAYRRCAHILRNCFVIRELSPIDIIEIITGNLFSIFR